MIVVINSVDKAATSFGTQLPLLFVYVLILRVHFQTFADLESLSKRFVVRQLMMYSSSHCPTSLFNVLTGAYCSSKDFIMGGNKFVG